MSFFNRLVDWWWSVCNGEEWSNSYPEIPADLECPDTQPTSPGALDSDLARRP